MKDLVKKSKEIKSNFDYIKRLNQSLVSQSHNQLFYLGDITAGAKDLTREVSNVMCIDRCSVWLYAENKEAIECEQLFIKEENMWHQGHVLYKSDYPAYFERLDDDPIIVANDAEKHPATSCFLENYLKPLSIKSMLDVPIIFRGEVIGVICLESYIKRKWIEPEINFAQLLSSLYSFAYSTAVNQSLQKDIYELEKFVDQTSLITKADKKGKITYVNHRFEQVSGWPISEVLGKDHNIVNSGEHPPEFWKEMYRLTLKERGIWHGVITNKSKDGSLYYVDSYIKANFDSETGEFKGFMSIRQDITELIRVTKLIEKKNTYLEHAAKIIRHDMHSGINTYIPRGISALERRLTDDQKKDLKIDAPIRMIKEGLRHTQKVYRGVYEFTNLVKKDSVLNKEDLDLKEILEDYLSSTAYRPQVFIQDLGRCEVNEPLFCTALDNLIRNGLKYNDSQSKEVKIYRVDDEIFVEDNGRGMTSEEFKHLSKPYKRKEGQKEGGTGLGLNICIAILEEHGFSISCKKIAGSGTQIKIKLNRNED